MKGSLPIDIRFELEVARMERLEKALRATNAFLEKGRYVSIMEDLAGTYRKVNNLAYLLELGRDVEGFHLVEIVSVVVVEPIILKPQVHQDLSGYSEAIRVL